MNTAELVEKLAIREFAVDDHREGHRPFTTEYLYERGGKVCPHCRNARACACQNCTLARTTMPAPCSVCRWTEHVEWVGSTTTPKK